MCQLLFNQRFTFVLLSLSFFTFFQKHAIAQCANDNSYYVDLTPTGVGNTQTTTTIYAGDYALVTVCLGAEYLFESCGTSYDTEITLYDDATGSFVTDSDADNCSGSDESFTWIATFNGDIRVLIDRWPCSSNSINSTLKVTQNTDCSTPATGGQDCATRTPICSNSALTGNSSGAGIVADLDATNQGCLGVEHQSSWYAFTIKDPGNLTMTIGPSPGVDYDFGLWGPEPACPPATTPIRCSYADEIDTFNETGSYATGFGSTGTNRTDGNGTDVLDGWASELPVLAGETYVLLIDNFTADATPFTLTWSGSGSLDCNILPVQWKELEVENVEKGNLISWKVAMELNNEYYEIEHSTDGIQFNGIGKVSGAVNSNVDLEYFFLDKHFGASINYYRIKQVDFNGAYEYSKIALIDNSVDEMVLIRVVDLLGKDLSVEQEKLGFYTDLRMLLYANGKKFVWKKVVGPHPLREN